MTGTKTESGHAIPETFLGSLGISSPRRILIFFASALAAIGVVLVTAVFSDLEPAGRRALFILLFAALLWVTEAVPAYAVGILIIGLNIALLGRPEGVFAQTTKDWEQFVLIIGHPLVWLFFGGFVLAAGMARTGLDRWIATRLLRRLGERPASILLGVMLVAFVLSMFMSNTATTAMMVAMLAPLMRGRRKDHRFVRGLLLGTAVGANLGGMGSLIGTPPNAIAVGVLSDLPEGVHVTFLEWMLIGLPPGLLLLGMTWGMLVRLYPSSTPTVRFDLDTAPGEQGDGTVVPRWQTLVVSGTLLLTVGLWMTAQWHGLPTAVVSFLPIVLFTITGILCAEHIRGLNYDVLFLLAGGLALGQVVTGTGLSEWIVDRLPVEGLGVAGTALVVAYVTVVLSNFMSNTAAANIIIPIGVTMAVGSEARIAIPVALEASAAMCLPIATPPNAMVFATGRCESRDFLRVGLVVGLITPALAVLWTSLMLGRILALH